MNTPPMQFLYINFINIFFFEGLIRLILYGGKEAESHDCVSETFVTTRPIYVFDCSSW